VRWNGSRWYLKDPWAGTGSGLLGVERSPSGSVWAVGWKETSLGRPRPYIVRRSSSGWKVIKSAALASGSAVLTDVSFRGGKDGYAVGYLAPKGKDKSRAILEHWNGQAWSLVDLPWANDFAALPRSVSVGDDGQVWIAGTQPANDRREPRGFIAHLENGTWEVSVLGVPSDIRSEVMAIAATKWGSVAAASVGASLLVLKSCDDGSPALAANSKRVKRSKVQVGNIKARRDSARLDGDHLPENPAIPDDAAIDAEIDDGAFSLAGETGGSVTLASPVKHAAFWVSDQAAESGLKQWTKTYNGFASDFDGNGYRDVFFSRHGTINPRLAMNRPAGFTNAPTSAFSSVDRHGCDKGDVDHDGAKDILCAVGASRGKAMKRHELSLAPNKARRELVKGALGISDPLGRGRLVALFKLDDDPYPEAFIVNAPDRDDGWPGYSRFYRNAGGRFVPAPGVGLDSSHGAECVEASDVDQDGDEDLVYCTQYGFAGRAAGLRFMRNENGVLKDRTVGQEIRQIGDIDVAFADVSGDGRKDLIQLSPTRLRVSKWTSAGYRKIYETRITYAWALAAGDASGEAAGSSSRSRSHKRPRAPPTTSSPSTTTRTG